MAHSHLWNACWVILGNQAPKWSVDSSETLLLLSRPIKMECRLNKINHRCSSCVCFLQLVFFFSSCKKLWLLFLDFQHGLGSNTSFTLSHRGSGEVKIICYSRLTGILLHKVWKNKSQSYTSQLYILDKQNFFTGFYNFLRKAKSYCIHRS